MDYSNVSHLESYIKKVKRKFKKKGWGIDAFFFHYSNPVIPFEEYIKIFNKNDYYTITEYGGTYEFIGVNHCRGGNSALFCRSKNKITILEKMW